MICKNCGAEVTGAFCMNCGTSASVSGVNLEKTENNGTNYITPVQNSYQNNSNPNPNPNPYNSQPVYNNIQVNMPSTTTTIGGWVGWLLLISFLNIIGVIIMLATTKDESAKNFAKAYLIFFLICIALAVILLLVSILIPAMIGYSSINY